MDVFDLAAKIRLDTSAYEKGLSDAEGQTNSFVSRVGSGIQKFTKAIGVALTGAATALSGGVIALTKQAVGNFAEYEQLVGGMDSLFGESSKKIQEYAARAYETSGVSANKYMEITTTFSAALIKGLAGDTDKAADLADKAIRDMGDNANRFGTNVENLQMAYRNFARQNYTMLDNLNLGYGGTARGMFELLSDAASMNKEFAKTANFSIDSSGHLTAEFSDMIEAIHIVQQGLNITGTTAQEAEHTIEGSSKAVRASWQNLITGLADGNADIGNLVDIFLRNVEKSADNLLPTIERAVNGVISLAGGFIERAPALINKFLPTLTKAITSLTKSVAKALPELIKGGGMLISALVDGILDNSDEILGAIGEVIDYLVDSFADGLPSILDKGADVIVKIADGITKGLPKILPAISKIIANLADGIERNMPKILEAGEKIFNGIISALKDTRSITSIIKTATKLVTSLVTALPQVIKGLLDAMPKVINNLMNAITENMPAIIRGLVSVVDAIIENAPTILQGLVDNAEKIITAVLRGITENLPDLVEGATKMIDKLAEFLKENASDIGKNVSDLITALVTAITDPEVLSDLLQAAVDIIAAIANGFKDIVTDEKMWESVLFAANAIIDALLQGIVNIGTAIWEIGEYIFDQIMVGLGLKDAESVGEKWGKSFLSGTGKAFKTGLLTAENYNEWYDRKKKYGSLKIGDSLETYRMSGKLAAGDRLATQAEISAGKYRILEGTDGQQFAIYDPLKGNKAVPSRKDLTYDAARQSELAAVSSLTGGNALKYQMAIEAVTGAAAGMAGKGLAEAAARAMQNQFRDTLAIYGENGTPLNPSAFTQVTLQVDKQTFGKVTYQQNKMASAIRGKALVDVGLSY